MLAAIEALEAIPRVQIERVQQYMSTIILELWLFVRTEIRPAKEFAQTVRNVLVLPLDDIAVVVELVDGIRITLSRHLIGFKSSTRLKTEDIPVLGGWISSVFNSYALIYKNHNAIYV